MRALSGAMKRYFICWPADRKCQNSGIGNTEERHEIHIFFRCRESGRRWRHEGPARRQRSGSGGDDAHRLAGPCGLTDHTGDWRLLPEARGEVSEGVARRLSKECGAHLLRILLVV